MTSPSTGCVKAVSFRLGPGEDVCAGLADAIERSGAQGGVVVSAVGSLAEVTYALVTFDGAGRPHYTEPHRAEGAIELLGLQGHFGRTETDESGFHLHGTFALGNREIVGGHVLGARVLVTLEGTLLVGPGAEWKVVPFAPDDEAYARQSRRMFVFLPVGEEARS